MSSLPRILLAALLAFSLSSCSLINAAIQTAYQLWPLLIMADGKPVDSNSPEAVKARARQIHNAPAFDGRMDWIKNDKSAGQGVAAR